MAYVKPKESVSRGTWIPKLISGPSGASIAVQVFSAEYCTAGGLVFLTFDMTVTAKEDGNPSSFVMIEGLPFRSGAASSKHCGSVIVSYFSNLDTELNYMSGSVLSNSYSCDMWCAPANVSTLQHLERGDVRVGTRLQGSITYMSAE